MGQRQQVTDFSIIALIETLNYSADCNKNRNQNFTKPLHLVI